MKNKIYLIVIGILFLGIISASSSNFYISDRLNPSNVHFFINGTTGNVGIGTSSPSYKNHIVGNILASGIIYSEVDFCIQGGECLSTSGVGSEHLTGSGTANYIPMWDGTTSLTNSPINIVGDDIKISDRNLRLNNGFSFMKGGFNVMNFSQATTTVFGADAGNPEIYYQTVAGYQAGKDHSVQNSYQTAIGYQAGYNNSGNNQVAVGYRAGYSNLGNDQVAIGYLSGYLNKGSRQTVFGYFTGVGNQGSYQTAIGTHSGAYNQGKYQTAIGSSAGEGNQGEHQTAIGSVAGNSNKGEHQTVVGIWAGYTTVGHSGNIHQTAIGYLAGYSSTSFTLNNYQTAVGRWAGQNNQGDYQLAIGTASGYQNKGENQTAIGYYSGYGNEGDYQTVMGYNAGMNNKGNRTIGIGYEVIKGNIGNDVVAFGSGAGKDNTLDNVFIVQNTNINATHPLVRGNFTSGILTATEWHQTSDILFKENIKDLNYGLKDVLLMKPKQFNFKNISGVRLGFIAQEMQEIIPELVIEGIEKEKSINYKTFSSVLIKSIQELYESNKEKKSFYFTEPFSFELKNEKDGLWNIEYVDENLQLKKELVDCDSKEIHHKKSCEKINYLRRENEK